jgi:hypothetical protein
MLGEKGFIRRSIRTRATALPAAFLGISSKAGMKSRLYPVLPVGPAFEGRGL